MKLRWDQSHQTKEILKCNYRCSMLGTDFLTNCVPNFFQMCFLNWFRIIGKRFISSILFSCIPFYLNCFYNISILVEIYSKFIIFRITVRGPMDFATFGRWVQNGGIEFPPSSDPPPVNRRNKNNRGGRRDRRGRGSRTSRNYNNPY